LQSSFVHLVSITAVRYFLFLTPVCPVAGSCILLVKSMQYVSTDIYMMHFMYTRKEYS